MARGKIISGLYGLESFDPETLIIELETNVSSQ